MVTTSCTCPGGRITSGRVLAGALRRDRSGTGWHPNAPAFKDLMRRKKKALVPAVIFFLVFYMSLPVLAGFTTLLDG